GRGGAWGGRRDGGRRGDDGRRAAGRGGAGARARASYGSSPRTGPPPPRSSSPPPGAPRLSERKLRELYAQLEVPYGAPFDEVKKSFRRLMRKYHPDLHIGNPIKHKTATQLTMALTQAYSELEQRLRGSRAK